MRLRAPRRAKLRTRVLLGVLAVTVLALVAFDIAAVTALRGYLISQTDQQLQEVLGLAGSGACRRRPSASAPLMANTQADQEGDHRADRKSAAGASRAVRGRDSVRQ
jgi:hypothetical protein